MKTQLYEGPVYGTLPVLSCFMARTGKTIHDVNFVDLDEQGNVQDPGPAKSRRSDAQRQAPRASRSFSPTALGPHQTLYYFSTNLADDGIGRTGFLAFCANLGPADAFIKSASYLLHSGGFNNVRNLLLEHSATILQDDSGIPLAYFDQRKWRLQPFGRYVGPLSIFANSYQAKMGELFRKATPIDFGIGYRFRRNESNLLLAEKVDQKADAPALAPSLPNDNYPQATESPPRKKVRSANGAAAPRRKQTESDTTGSLGCGIPGVFSFCSVPEAKSGR